jgi:hypothetical protein
MAYFQTQNPDLGKFWRVLQLKILENYMVILSILRLFGIFCGHLTYFMIIWYNFYRLGMLYQQKSGYPGVGKQVSMAFVQVVD